MTISIRLSEIDHELIKTFAKYKDMTTSEYIRTVVLEDIEKEYQALLERQIAIQP